MSKTKKSFELEYVNNIKEELGYSKDSLNLTVMNNANSVGKVFLFGALSSLSLRAYNLSFEDNGILLIQRSTVNNQLIPEKNNFIDNSEIKSITFKNGILQHKLVIENTDGKKIIFKINKVIANVPWQKSGIAETKQRYGK